MRRIVITALFLMTLAFFIWMTFLGKRGLFHIVRLREELQEIKKDSDKLHKENAQLKTEISGLKTNIRYLEELARNELGLSKDGELVYRLENKK